MVGETALGRNSSSDAVKAFKKIGGPKWANVGVFGLITCCFVLSFYIIVAGWSLYYLYIYVFDYSTLTHTISVSESKGLPPQAGIGQFFGEFVTNGNKVLLFAGLFMLMTIGIVAVNVKSGIEFVSKRFVPLLIILLVVLIIATPILGNKNQTLTILNLILVLCSVLMQVDG